MLLVDAPGMQQIVMMQVQEIQMYVILTIQPKQIVKPVDVHGMDVKELLLHVQLILGQVNLYVQALDVAGHIQVVLVEMEIVVQL